MPGSQFIGREDEQQSYLSFLRSSSQWILEITGLGGCGKSRLLSHFKELHSPESGQEIPIPTIIEYNFAAEPLRINPETQQAQAKPIDALALLSDLAGQIKPYCDQNQYMLLMATIEKGRDSVKEQSAQIFQIISGDNGSNQDGFRQSVNINDYEDKTRQVQQNARDSSADAFYAMMDTFTLNHLLLMLDTCEWLNESVNSEIGPWLLNTFLLRLHRSINQQGKKCQIIIASSISLPLLNIPEDEYEELPLTRLKEETVQQHLNSIGVHDPALQHSIYEITHGHAACFAIMCEVWSKMKTKLVDATDILELRRAFNQHAEKKFINKHILDARLKPPLYEMTRYSALLRSFNLPLLQNVFSNLPELQLTDPRNYWYFTRFTERPYIEDLGRQRYTLIPLLREVLPESIRRQEPDKWETYHRRALDSLESEDKKASGFSFDVHYHTIALELTYDKEQNIEYWQDQLYEARKNNAEYGIMLDVANDKTLMFTSLAYAAKAQM